MTAYTPRFSVCVPAGDHWAEMSAHTNEATGLAALGLQLVTDPDAALFDFSTNPATRINIEGLDS